MKQKIPDIILFIGAFVAFLIGLSFGMELLDRVYPFISDNIFLSTLLMFFAWAWASFWWIVLKVYSGIGDMERRITNLEKHYE